MNSQLLKSGKNLDADLVIIGGGGAGLPAAVAAAEAGLKADRIILLEARSSLGGNAVFPLGIFAVGSRLQRSMSIDARADDIFRKAMKYAHWRVDPRLIRALLDKSGDTIHWLEDKGIHFSNVIHHFPNQVPEVYHIVSPPARTGATIVKTLGKICEDLGIHLFYQTSANRLITDERGNIAGVQATSKQGDLHISTKTVIVATGGFAGNKELIKRYFPSYEDKEVMHRMGMRYKGDGLRMVSEVGAIEEESIVLEMGAPKFNGPPSIDPLVSRPNVIWANMNGSRFADETLVYIFPEAANILSLQPGKTCYVLLDEKIKQRIIKEGFDPLETITMGKTSWPAGLDKEIHTQVEKGAMMVSDSWNDIEAWAGTPAGVLKKTVEEYNSFCEQGYDKMYLKERVHLIPLDTPPFYAIRCGVDIITTHGGIKINHKMEVLNKQNIPIKGLFAAGVDTGGTESNTYNFYLSGHAFGFSVYTGRIAGENAANYITGMDY